MAEVAGTQFIPLEQWVTVGEVAKILGISRQGVHARIERGKFETVYYITGENGKVTYLLDRQYVMSLVT